MAYPKTSSRSRAAYTTLLTVAALFYSVCLAQTCDRGWFGSDCQYMCHCAGNTECDRDTGGCSGGCDLDWFGPGCQYYISEFITSGTPRSNLGWLTDNDDRTCNTWNAQPITVSLVTPHPLTWIRVVVSDAASLNQYQLSYQTSNSQSSTLCADVRSSRVNDKTLDISCPTSQVVSHVTLSGDILRGMCSLYISGGRNVALNQTTQQTTTLWGQDKNGTNVRWYAKHAVDGNPGIPDDLKSLKSTCSHTKERNQGWWRVKFSDAVYINRFLIYNRREPSRDDSCCQHRLKGFTLDAHRSYGSDRLFVYRDSTPEPQDVYSIVPSPRISFSVDWVRIFTATRFLTLCEVYVFGEVACAFGKFGRECERDCNCAVEEACFVSTGGCPSGCGPGFTGEDCHTSCRDGQYGSGCTETCSDHCAGPSNSCNRFTGSCDSGCQPGYLPPLCKEDCAPGRYGKNCTKNCSVHCAGESNSCHHVSGTCSQGCDDGYLGPLCTLACEDGRYGSGCTETCSDHCAGPSSSCDRFDGSCDSGCEPGYQSPLCKEECAPGRYGKNCTKNCSVHCAGESNSCHHANGICFQGCDAGYLGPLCTLVKGQQGGEEGSGAGAALPAIVGVIVAILIIAAIVAVFLVLRRRTRNDNERGSETDKEFKPDRMTFAHVNAEIEQSPSGPRRNSSRQTIVNNEREAENGEDTDEDSDSDTTECPYTNLQTGNTAVPVGKLKAYIHRHATDSHFKDQFTTIAVNAGHTQSQGRAAKNSTKNRYKDIIPYDRSRVLLKVDEQKDQDNYINASFVKGYNESETFIASQGPNNVILDDFVRMLWEQKIDRVVMLTNLVELGKRKCSQYWPEDEEKWLGEITVQLLTTRVYDEYTIRHLRLCKAGEPPRDLTQFHFTAWPDKSVPDNSWGLVDFQQRVMATPASGPLLVHCSAGVGRTGTFIALCNLLREAEATGKMDFRSTLWNLRQDRMQMIQTVAQYTFLHKAALVAHTTSGTTIQAKDIPARLKVLESGRPGNTSARTYQREFDDVCAVVCHEDALMTREERETIHVSKHVPANTRKDRVSNILPKTAYRPVLTVERDSKDSYINAVLVPSIRQISQDVLTQLPLPSTVNDFWRLATQYRVSVILAFQTDAAHLDKTIGEFLPKSGTEPLRIESFEISSATLGENSVFKELSLNVQKKDMGGASNRSQQHSLTCILSKVATLEPESLLQIVEKLKASRPRQTSRAAFMCRNGADYCGLACVLSILLDRLEIDQCLTVPLVVGAIKAIRPQIIPTVEQYKCLHQTLRLAHKSKNVYENVRAISQK